MLFWFFLFWYYSLPICVVCFWVCPCLRFHLVLCLIFRGIFLCLLPNWLYFSVWTSCRVFVLLVLSLINCVCTHRNLLIFFLCLFQCVLSVVFFVFGSHSPSVFFSSLILCRWFSSLLFQCLVSVKSHWFYYGVVMSDIYMYWYQFHVIKDLLCHQRYLKFF